MQEGEVVRRGLADGAGRRESAAEGWDRRERDGAVGEAVGTATRTGKSGGAEEQGLEQLACEVQRRIEHGNWACRRTEGMTAIDAGGLRSRRRRWYHGWAENNWVAGLIDGYSSSSDGMPWIDDAGSGVVWMN